MAYQDESGKELPALRDKPKISLEISEIVVAFKVLSAMRTNNGFGPNPLSLVEVKAYIDLVGLPWMGNQIFVELIAYTDRAYLKLVKEAKGKN